MSVVRPVTTNGPLASVGLPDGVVKEIRGVLTSVEVAKPKGALFLSGGLAKVAAGGIAHELGRGLFHVDLSRVVSKFIGETEKNLDAAFAAAEGQGAILFFDEADALFGRRTQTTSSNDRYANQEVSYLLQRMEDFPGVVILATNLKANLDEAFSRRFQSMIYFPMPGPEQRLLLWEQSFPEKMVFEDKEGLATIAEKYEMTGGSIINVTRYVSLLAVKQGTNVVRHKDILAGIRKEFSKEGKTIQ